MAFALGAQVDALLMRLRGMRERRETAMERIAKAARALDEKQQAQKVEAAGPPRTFGQAVKPSAE